MEVIFWFFPPNLLFTGILHVISGPLLYKCTEYCITYHSFVWRRPRARMTSPWFFSSRLITRQMMGGDLARLLYSLYCHFRNCQTSSIKSKFRYFVLKNWVGHKSYCPSVDQFCPPRWILKYVLAKSPPKFSHISHETAAGRSLIHNYWGQNRET